MNLTYNSTVTNHKPCKRLTLQGLRDICLRGWGLGSSAVQQVCSKDRCSIHYLDPTTILTVMINYILKLTPGPPLLLDMGSRLSSFKLAPGQQEDLNTERDLQDK